MKAFLALALLFAGQVHAELCHVVIPNELHVTSVTEYDAALENKGYWPVPDNSVLWQWGKEYTFLVSGKICQPTGKKGARKVCSTIIYFQRQNQQGPIGELSAPYFGSSVAAAIEALPECRENPAFPPGSPDLN